MRICAQAAKRACAFVRSIASASCLGHGMRPPFKSAPSIFPAASAARCVIRSVRGIALRCCRRISFCRMSRRRRNSLEIKNGGFGAKHNCWPGRWLGQSVALLCQIAFWWVEFPTLKGGLCVEGNIYLIIKELGGSVGTERRCLHGMGGAAVGGGKVGGFQKFWRVAVGGVFLSCRQAMICAMVNQIAIPKTMDHFAASIKKAANCGPVRLRPIGR